MHINSTSGIPIQIVITPSFATGVITGAVGMSVFALMVLRHYERRFQSPYPFHDELPMIEVEAEEIILEAEPLETEPKGE